MGRRKTVLPHEAERWGGKKMDTGMRHLVIIVARIYSTNQFNSQHPPSAYYNIYMKNGNGLMYWGRRGAGG